jgi:hypothetical protein
MVFFYRTMQKSCHIFDMRVVEGNEKERDKFETVCKMPCLARFVVKGDWQCPTSLLDEA